MAKHSRSRKNALTYLAGQSGWVSGLGIPDGNGRTGGASGAVLMKLKAEGLIEYGKEPTHSLYGWRITPAGRAALAQESKP